MLCKDRSFLLSLRVAVALLTVTCLVTVLQAQTATDPGARPTGREAVNSDPNAICPVTGNKFSETVCLDFVQPPSPNITADGAGAIVANGGNLAGTWFQALTVFQTIASVNGTDDNGNAGQFIRGLGPSFNAESCFQCHSQPAIGGSSPGCAPDSQVAGGTLCSNMLADPSNGKVTATFTSSNNPEIFDATDRGADNQPPSFVKSRAATGPLLEARFPGGFGSGPSTLGNPASVPKGAVAELYVITGRTDAQPPGSPACNATQEPFASVTDIVFRIPIPTFGDGFVENTPEPNLNNAAEAAKQEAATVCGSSNPTCGINFQVFNTSGNDQTITRFGWKAQNKSLLMFSGEASNVEMGVTNELFPTERTYGNFPDCTTNKLPEDVTQSLTGNQIEAITGPLNGSQPSDEPGVTSVISSNIENDAIFMRLNGAPSICNWDSGVSSTTGLSLCKLVDQSVLRGAALFGNSILPAPNGTAPTNIGCVLCHWQTQTTGPSTTPSLSNANFHPFSDFALHTMDPSLADRVMQGTAGGQQFRTAPLWGVGQRLFFLHDGRANDLLTAIQDHCLSSAATPSEACQVIANFTALPATSGSSCQPNGTNCVPSQEDILHFLRSL